MFYQEVETYENKNKKQQQTNKNKRKEKQTNKKTKKQDYHKNNPRKKNNNLNMFQKLTLIFKNVKEHDV